MNDHPFSRREWLAGAGLVLGAGLGSPNPQDRSPRPAEAGSIPGTTLIEGRMEPWLEIDGAALAHNATTLSRLSGNRQIVAMAKNNCYGMGLEVGGRLLDRLPEVWGFGVVRTREALALRGAGVRKPVVLMGPAGEEEAADLVQRGVRLTASSTGDRDLLERLAARLDRPVPIHLYVDTGMHRMGIPHDRVLAWLESSTLRRAIRIEGTMTELVEDQDYDRQQTARLKALASQAAAGNLSLGRLHAASSDALLRPTPETFLDLVRPGLALFGGYPTPESRARNELRPGYRLKTRVIRLDRLAPGEGVSYHHRFKATRPTLTATLAIGHVDGYPAGAVKGCQVLIRERLYPVIGTVSASHTVVVLEDGAPVAIGDEAVLVGPDRPELHPNEVAAVSGWSEYNMFMHLPAELPRISSEDR